VGCECRKRYKRRPGAWRDKIRRRRVEKQREKPAIAQKHAPGVIVPNCAALSPRTESPPIAQNESGGETKG